MKAKRRVVTSSGRPASAKRSPTARRVRSAIVPASPRPRVETPSPPPTAAWPTTADETADVGIDLGTPVVEAIGAEAKSRFTGRIPKLTVQTR